MSICSQAVKRNTREREEERTSDGAMIDGSMLWFIMHHLRQGRLRRVRQARGEPDTDTSDTVSEDGEFSLNESEDSEGEGMEPPMSCNPS